MQEVKIEFYHKAPFGFVGYTNCPYCYYTHRHVVKSERYTDFIKTGKLKRRCNGKKYYLKPTWRV